MRVTGAVLNAEVRLRFGYAQAQLAPVGERSHEQLTDECLGKRDGVLPEKLAARHHSTILSV